jgi:hypothetical protein
VSDLQKIARRTAGLERNWSRENPRIIGAVRTIQCGGFEGPLSILAAIPGTNILVLHSPVQLFCLDLATTSFWPPQRIGDICSHALFDEHGKHFIALVYSIEQVYACYYNHFAVSHKSQLRYVYRYLLEVFCVDYGPGALNIIRKVYRSNAFSTDFYLRSVFMQDAIVGMVYIDTEQLFLMAFNIYTNESITIPLSFIDIEVRFTSPYCPLPTLRACRLASLFTTSRNVLA